MNFYPKKRRTPVLQIISLIDILIILLIFLVVSTTFKESQPALNVSLPTSKEMSAGTVTSGRLSVVLTKDGEVFVGDAPSTLETLTDTLTTLRAGNPAVQLELRVDEKAGFGSVVSLWDSLTKSGFNVSDVPARLQRPGGS